MFYYFFAFILLSPLLGILLVESGEPVLLVKAAESYYNGTSVVYSIHLIVILIVFLIINKNNIGLFLKKRSSDYSFVFNNVALFILIINIIFLLITLFAFGGYQVLTGITRKEELRGTLGFFGAFAYLILKFYVPTLMAFLTFFYLKSERAVPDKLILLLNYLVASLTAACFGFKTSSITILLPSLMLIFWKMRLKHMIFFSGACVVVILALGYWFDLDVLYEDMDLFTFILKRATVMQGEVVWKVWDLYGEGEKFPNYVNTLYPIIGDQLFSWISGITPADVETWVNYHYGWLLNVIVRGTYEDFEMKINVSGTTFAEGVIALGSPLFIIFSIISGILVGVIYINMKYAKFNDLPISYALLSSYMVWQVLSWINGGGIDSVLHISILFGYITAYLLLKIIEDTCCKKIYPVEVPAVNSPNLP